MKTIQSESLYLWKREENANWQIKSVELLDEILFMFCLKWSRETDENDDISCGIAVWKKKKTHKTMTISRCLEMRKILIRWKFDILLRRLKMKLYTNRRQMQHGARFCLYIFWCMYLAIIPFEKLFYSGNRLV